MRGGGSHLAEPLAEDALGGEDLLSHAAQLLHGPGPAHAPAHSHTRGAPGRAPDGGRARCDPPRSPRAPRHNTAEGRAGGPQIPRRPMGSRGRGDPAWGVGGGIVCVRPLLFLPRGGGRCPAGAGTMGWPGPGLCLPGRHRGFPGRPRGGIPPARPRQGLLLRVPRPGSLLGTKRPGAGAANAGPRRSPPGRAGGGSTGTF